MSALAHSHRPTTNPAPKAFKSRKATKSQLRAVAKGRIDLFTRKSRPRQAMSKLDRKNQTKQRQLAKLKEHQKETSVFAGRDGAPRIVAVLPLCSDGDARAAVRTLNESLDIVADLGPGCTRVPVDRFKQRLQYVPVDRDLTACLDAARAADFVVVVFSATVEVDAVGELILRSVESQGLSTLFTCVQGLDAVEAAKDKQAVLASLRSYIMHFHPEQEKLFSLDSRQDCSNLMRALCSTTPKGVHWRDERSWMLVEDVRFPSSSDSQSNITVLTGVVRGRGLKADRLIHLGDIGTFQVERITAAPLARAGELEDGMAVDEPEEELDVPGDDRDDLAVLAPEEAAHDGDDDDAMSAELPSAQRGVLLDSHHYFSDGEKEIDKAVVKKRVPKGTSTYQAAWYLGGDDDGDYDDDDDDNNDKGDIGGQEAASDLQDLDMQDVGSEAPARPEDGIEGLAAPTAPTEAADVTSQYLPLPSEAFVEPTADEDAAQLKAYRAQRREVQDDKEFPDEIELHPKVLARERLARFRGLKSVRTSPWEEKEDRPHEPANWRQLLRIRDYQGSKARSTREALAGGVAPGTRVRVHLKDVPATFAETYDARRPVTLVSLLRHEHKQTLVNYLISLGSDCPTSIKSKQELVMQCGPRRFVAKVVFSQPGTTPNNVHKYCRFLHPGQSAVASFIGPVTWGSVPVLFFKRSGDGAGAGLELAATGTSLAPSTTRVVAKRVVLTGHPLHIHKKVVTVRYMFFNRDDVEWFKALPLWTRRGRTGYVREAMGTHGYFKATFDGVLNPQDSIGVSLYKRVFPRPSVPWTGRLLGDDDDDDDDGGGGETAMEDVE